MMNFKRRNSHGQHGLKRRVNWLHTRTWIARIHSHSYINTVTTTCAKRQLSYYRIWNRIITLKVHEGG